MDASILIKEEHNYASLPATEKRLPVDAYRIGADRSNQAVNPKQSEENVFNILNDVINEFQKVVLNSDPSPSKAPEESKKGPQYLVYNKCKGISSNCNAVFTAIQGTEKIHFTVEDKDRKTEAGNSFENRNKKDKCNRNIKVLDSIGKVELKSRDVEVKQNKKETEVSNTVSDQLKIASRKGQVVFVSMKSDKKKKKIKKVVIKGQSDKKCNSKFIQTLNDIRMQCSESSEVEQNNHRQIITENSEKKNVGKDSLQEVNTNSGKQVCVPHHNKEEKKVSCSKTKSQIQTVKSTSVVYSANDDVRKNLEKEVNIKTNKDSEEDSLSDIEVDKSLNESVMDQSSVEEFPTKKVEINFKERKQISNKITMENRNANDKRTDMQINSQHNHKQKASGHTIAHKIKKPVNTTSDTSFDGEELSEISQKKLENSKKNNKNLINSSPEMTSGSSNIKKPVTSASDISFDVVKLSEISQKKLENSGKSNKNLINSSPEMISRSGNIKKPVNTTSDTSFDGIKLSEISQKKLENSEKSKKNLINSSTEMTFRSSNILCITLDDEEETYEDKSCDNEKSCCESKKVYNSMNLIGANKIEKQGEKKFKGKSKDGIDEQQPGDFCNQFSTPELVESDKVKNLQVQQITMEDHSPSSAEMIVVPQTKNITSKDSDDKQEKNELDHNSKTIIVSDKKVNDYSTENNCLTENASEKRKMELDKQIIDLRKQLKVVVKQRQKMDNKKQKDSSGQIGIVNRKIVDDSAALQHNQEIKTATVTAEVESKKQEKVIAIDPNSVSGMSGNQTKDVFNYKLNYSRKTNVIQEKEDILCITLDDEEDCYDHKNDSDSNERVDNPIVQNSCESITEDSRKTIQELEQEGVESRKCSFSDMVKTSNKNEEEPVIAFQHEKNKVSSSSTDVEFDKQVKNKLPDSNFADFAISGNYQVTFSQANELNLKNNKSDKRIAKETEALCITLDNDQELNINIEVNSKIDKPVNKQLIDSNNVNKGLTQCTESEIGKQLQVNMENSKSSDEFETMNTYKKKSLIDNSSNLNLNGQELTESYTAKPKTVEKININNQVKSSGALNNNYDKESRTFMPDSIRSGSRNVSEEKHSLHECVVRNKENTFQEDVHLIKEMLETSLSAVQGMLQEENNAEHKDENINSVNINFDVAEPDQIIVKHFYQESGKEDTHNHAIKSIAKVSRKNQSCKNNRSYGVSNKEGTKKLKMKKKGNTGSFSVDELEATKEQTIEDQNFNDINDLDNIDCNLLKDFPHHIDGEIKTNSDKKLQLLHIEDACKRDHYSNSLIINFTKQAYIRVKRLTDEDIARHPSAAEYLAQIKSRSSDDIKKKTDNDESKGSTSDRDEGHKMQRKKRRFICVFKESERINSKKRVKNSQKCDKLGQNQTTGRNKRALSHDESQNNDTDAEHSEGSSISGKRRSVSLSGAKEKDDTVFCDTNILKTVTPVSSSETVQVNRTSTVLSKLTTKHKKDGKYYQQSTSVATEPALFSQPDRLVKVLGTHFKERESKPDKIVKDHTFLEKNKVAVCFRTRPCSNPGKFLSTQLESYGKTNVENCNTKAQIRKTNFIGKFDSMLNNCDISKGSTIENTNSSKTNTASDLLPLNVDFSMKTRTLQSCKKEGKECIEIKTMIHDVIQEKSLDREVSSEGQIINAESISENESQSFLVNKIKHVVEKGESSSFNNNKGVSSEVNSECIEIQQIIPDCDTESSNLNEHQTDVEPSFIAVKHPSEIDESTIEVGAFKKLKMQLDKSSPEKNSEVSFEQSNSNENHFQARKSTRLIQKRNYEGMIGTPEKTDKKILSEKDLTVGKKKQAKSSTEEDDPTKLWCICRKPHGNRFMIECDLCKDWFHGNCVGVSEEDGLHYEKEKREWKCPICIAKSKKVSSSSLNEESSLSKNSQEKKIQNEQLFEPSLKECVVQLDASSISNFKSYNVSGKCDSFQVVDQKNNESVDCFLKNVSHEKDITKSIADVESNVENPFPISETSPEHESGMNTSKTNIVLSKDSKNVEQHVKSTHEKSANVADLSLTSKRKKESKKSHSKEAKKCIACSNPSRQNSCYCCDECIKKHVAHAMEIVQSVKDVKPIDMDSRKAIVYDRIKGTVVNGDKRPCFKDAVEWLTAHQNFIIACPKISKQSGKEYPKKKEANVDEGDNPAVKTFKPLARSTVQNSFKKILMGRCENSDDFKKPKEYVHKIAEKIEDALYSLFKDDYAKYCKKYRSLMFNIKDPRNKGLFRKVLDEICPKDLVKMSHEELASHELAEWREKENQHCLDVIKRVNLEHQKKGNSSLLKKTHKGEVEIEDDLSVLDRGLTKTKAKIPQDDNAKSDKSEDPITLPMDTTNEHGIHAFCKYCKICLAVIPPPQANKETSKIVRVARTISFDETSKDPKSEKASSRTSNVLFNDVESKYQKTAPTDFFESSEERLLTKKVSLVKADSCVWKGVIDFPTVAKILTTAHKVSGNTLHLQQDLQASLYVVGKTDPHQVVEYLNLIKQRDNKELAVIRFKPANEDESVGYDTLYDYLINRKCYGVLKDHTKRIKDAYIMPLPPTSPVPIVLMPFVGPGLPPNRSRLLLGVVVKNVLKTDSNPSKVDLPNPPKYNHRKQGSSSAPAPSNRSYTPPLSNFKQGKTSGTSSHNGHASSAAGSASYPIELDDSPPNQIKNSNLYESSHTPPLRECYASKFLDDVEPYDPELSISNYNALKQNTVTNLDELISVDHETYKKLVAVTQEQKETDEMINALKKSVGSENSDDWDSLDISSVTQSNMTSFLNLSEIAPEFISVPLKSDNKETTGEIDVDMRINSLFNRFNKVPNISPEFPSSKTIQRSLKVTSDVEKKVSSQGATPPPEDDEASSDQSSDPRIKLRTSFSELNFSPEFSHVSLSHMSASDLVECAQKQYSDDESAISYEKEISSPNFDPVSLLSPENNNLANNGCSKEPSQNLEMNNISYSDNAVVKGVTHSQTPDYFVQSSYETGLAQETGQVKSYILSTAPPAVPPPIVPSYQTYLPPGFSVQTPPPNFKDFPPSVITTSFPPPPIPPPPLPVSTITEQSKSHFTGQSWPPWQVSRQPQGANWYSHGNYNDSWRHQSNGYYSNNNSQYYPYDRSEQRANESSYYSQRSCNNNWNMSRPRLNRGTWQKHPPRGNGRENQRQPRRPFFYNKNFPK